MKIEINKTEKIGVVTESTPKYWKKNPSDFTSACQAASFYTKKFGEEMVIIPGNSYMRKVFHIARKNEDLKKYTASSSSVKCAVVTASGDVFYGIASK